MTPRPPRSTASRSRRSRRHNSRPGSGSRAITELQKESAAKLRHPVNTYLTHGRPIATGIIEGACRHLVKDRMDITGARWGLAGAEAILKLRAIKANGDFDAYWRYHLDQERHHIHEARYHNHIIPQAA